MRAFPDSVFDTSRLADAALDYPLYQPALARTYPSIPSHLRERTRYSASANPRPPGLKKSGKEEELVGSWHGFQMGVKANIILKNPFAAKLQCISICPKSCLDPVSSKIYQKISDNQICLDAMR
jgi:hypothetical protein